MDTVLMQRIPGRWTSLSARIAARLLPILVFSTIPIVAEAQTELLSAIKQCESQGRQFDERGRVLVNPRNHDVVGLFQISKRFHQRRAESLNLNIFTAQGNEAYVRILFGEYGPGPWVASRKCWRYATQ